MWIKMNTCASKQGLREVLGANAMGGYYWDPTEVREQWGPLTVRPTKDPTIRNSPAEDPVVEERKQYIKPVKMQIGALTEMG
jgi:hypothetical protein